MHFSDGIPVIMDYSTYPTSEHILNEEVILLQVRNVMLLLKVRQKIMIECHSWLQTERNRNLWIRNLWIQRSNVLGSSVIEYFKKWFETWNECSLEQFKLLLVSSVWASEISLTCVSILSKSQHSNSRIYSIHFNLFLQTLCKIATYLTNKTSFTIAISYVVQMEVYPL